MGISKRFQTETHIGCRQFNELDVSIEGVINQERRNLRIADDGGLQVLDGPKGVSGEDIAFGQYLDHPQVSRGRKALPDRIGGFGEVAVGR